MLTAADAEDAENHTARPLHIRVDRRKGRLLKGRHLVAGPGRKNILLDGGKLREVFRNRLHHRRGPVNGVLLEELGPVGRSGLLAVIDQGAALVEVDEGRPVPPYLPGAQHERGALIIMILEEAELDVVLRIGSFLPVQGVGVFVEGRRLIDVVPVVGEDIIFIFHVEGPEDLPVRPGVDAPGAVIRHEVGLHGLGQPEAARMHLFNFRSCLDPEVHRNQGSHVAAEAVDNARPVLQSFNLIVPEALVPVVEVDDVRPVADLVPEGAVFPVVEPGRMLLGKDGVGRGVIVDHVDDTLHPGPVDGVHQGLEVINGPVVRIHSPIVFDGIGGPAGSLSRFFSDRVDGHEPDDVGAQGLDPIHVPCHRSEGPFLTVVSHED